MNKRKRIFCIISSLYFISGIVLLSSVNEWIRFIIRTYGWTKFNAFFLPPLFSAGGFILGLIVYRFKIKFPTWKEWAWGILGILFAFLTLGNVVLLTTELVHIPQFMILTLLLFNAFPDELWMATAWSALACVVDEWLQSFIPNRVLDISDIFLNWIGLYIGLVTWWTWHIHVDSPEFQVHLHGIAPSNAGNSGKGLGEIVSGRVGETTNK